MLMDELLRQGKSYLGTIGIASAIREATTTKW